MKIAIIGAGGVGGPFGAALARGGHDVTFVARGAHLKAMQEKGLRVEGALGDFHLKPTQATDDPASIGPVDVVLFCVKLWDVESAGEAIRPLIGADTMVVPLQNGIDAADRLVPILGARHVVGGVALVNANIEAPGLIRQLGTAQKLVFGELEGGTSARTAAFAEACTDSGFEAEATADIRRALWDKFVFLVAISSLTALTRRNLGVVRSDPDIRPLLIDVAQETAAVGRAEGIDLPPDHADQRIAYADSLTPQNMASMAVDLLRGNRLELPWLAGKVVELGRNHGIETPVCRVVYGALKPYMNGTPA